MKLHYKIAAIFCAIMAVILIGVFTYLDFELEDYLYEKIKTAITKEVLLAKLFLEEDFPGYPRFKEITDLSISVGDVIDARVSIIGLEGTVLGDSDMPLGEVREMENHLNRPEIQQALSNGIGESRRFSTTIQRDMLYIAVALGKDTPLGFIRAAVPLTDIDHISERLKTTLFMALIVALLLSIILSFSAAFFVSRPIKKISKAAVAISDGDFTQRILVETGDEIEVLARSFNHMSSRVKATIDEIKSERSRLEAVLLSMSDGVMVVDTKSSIILVNEAFKKIFPTTEEVKGKKPLEVIRNIEIQEIADILMATSAGTHKREITIHIPAEKAVIVNGTPIIHDGEVEGAVMVFHDITEIRRLERMRSDFVSNVSHELRTPACNIKGFAETLSQGALDDRENAVEFVRIIEESSERLVNLIEDLLDLSKIESGKVPLKMEACSVRELVNKVILHLTEQAERKAVTIKNNSGKKRHFIYADEGLIFQALFNLIDNAIKYSGNSGNITVSSYQKNGYIEIEVKDNGPGIAREHLDRVFERFYRVDRSRSRETGSTGLGLSIVKNIAEAHGGSVSVESSPGNGSSFCLVIPSSQPLSNR